MAFEVARWLRRRGQRQPEHLFISGRRAPQISDDEPPWHLMSDEELISKLTELNGTPKELLNDLDLLQMMLPVIRADSEICETYEYVPEAPLDCPITAFGGTHDEEIENGMLDAWSAQTAKAFSQHLLEGDHFFIHASERKLLALLRVELSRITAEYSRRRYRLP